MIPGPAVLVPLAYGAGLATGLLHFWAPACGIGMLTLLVNRRAEIRLTACVLAAGAVAGRLALAADASSCASRLRPGQVEVTIRAVDVSAGRALVRARLPNGGCHGTIDVRWPHAADVQAGTTGRAQGRWVARPRSGGRGGGVLAVSRLDTLRIAPSTGEAARNAIVATSRRLYGSRAPLIEALVLGTRGTLDPALRDAFAHAGLVHLLSISGFHVGLLSAWIVLVARALGASRARALAAGAAVGIAYVAFLGWPAPGTRAAALAAILALLYRRQRRAAPNPLLAQTCFFVMLLAPWSIFDLGGWLSAAAMWGATTATRWSDRACGQTFLIRTLASSIGATFATAPITAAALGAVSLAGIALNLVAIPLAAVAVPGVGASLLAAQVAAGIGGALAAGSGLVLHLLELLADLGARIPGGHLVMPAETRSALPWLALLGTGLWISGRKNTKVEAARRFVLVAACAAWLSLVTPTFGSRSADAGRGLTLHFLDVGQGDGAAIRTPGGRWVVIDAGPRSAGSDAGRRVLVPFLTREGARRVAVLVVSHAHLDHLGGAEALLDRFGADLVLEPADQVADAAYTALLDALAAAGIPWKPARPGTAFVIDSVRFQVLHPDTTWSEWGLDVNEGSAILRVDYGAFSALFPGDAGFRAEARLNRRVGAVDVLKVGHHGSRGSTSEAWLAELAPRVAVISVGRNTYGHPAPDVLERLAARRIEVWRTDTDGSVTIRTNGRTMTVTGRGRSATYPVD
jgi:competence protein ComEC